jgi:hypothetical protein
MVVILLANYDLDQFASENHSVIADDDDDDFEIPDLPDLLKERERHYDILVAARNIRNERRLQSQRMSPELALVNRDRAENSREVRPGDSQGLSVGLCVHPAQWR